MPFEEKVHFLSPRTSNFYLDSRARRLSSLFQSLCCAQLCSPTSPRLLGGLPCLHFSSVSESFSVVLSQVCEPVTLEIYLDMS